MRLAAEWKLRARVATGRNTHSSFLHVRRPRVSGGGWKSFFRGIQIVDLSAFDKAKLIFTVAPSVENGDYPTTPSRRAGQSRHWEIEVSFPNILAEVSGFG
jgi:hypothetical protein